MKKSMQAKGIKVIMSFLLVMLLIGNTTVPVFAESNAEPAEGRQEMALSFTAGQHGVYEYDEETDSMVFIPPEEYIPSEPLSDDDVCLEQEADDELADILFSVAATTQNGVYESVNSPSGVEASVCLIGARFQSGSDRTHVKVGTGWLINNTYVVTAGHCLYDAGYTNNGHDGFAMHVAVYVGASNGAKKQYRMGHVKSVGGDFKKNAAGLDYSSKGMYDDWGVIKLDSAVTVSVSKLRLRVVNGYSNMQGKTYTNVGYPYDYGVNSSIWEDWTTYRMYRVKGTVYQELAKPYAVANADPQFIGLVASSELKAQPGQSGSPIYITENGVSYADGIVVSKYEGVPCILYINQWLYNYLTGLL